MSNKIPLIVAISAVVGGAVGSLVGQGISTSDTSKEVAALSSQVTSLEETISDGMVSAKPQSGEELAVAISQGVEAYFNKKDGEARQELFAKYDNAFEEVEGDDWVYGNPNARFTLYEFADTQCSFCQRFHGTPKKLADGSQGVLNWKYHHMAILSQKSKRQAVAGECAGELGGNRAFWVYMDDIYTNGSDYGDSEMVDLAVRLGLEKSEFEQCLASSDMQRYIAEETSAAQDQGVSGTPTSVLIDNKTGEREVISGAQSPGVFIQAMRGMLQAEKESQEEASDDAS